MEKKELKFKVGDKVKYYVPLMWNGHQDGQLEGADVITKIHRADSDFPMYCLKERGIRCFANELELI